MYNAVQFIQVLNRSDNINIKYLLDWSRNLVLEGTKHFIKTFLQYIITDLSL